MTMPLVEAARNAARALADLVDSLDAHTRSTAPSTAPHSPAALAPRPAPARPAPAGDAPTVPFGRDQGRFLSDVDDKCLTWLAAALDKSIADPAKGQYRRKNEGDLANVRAEQDRRFVR